MRKPTFRTTIAAMDHSQSAMQVALRVLKALTEDRLPDPRDMKRLRMFVPSLADLPVVELVCGVIREVIEQRAEEARKLLSEGA